MSDYLPPGNYPEPDFQGDLEECSRFALGKAIASGFMRKKFVIGQSIDVAQKEVIAVLCNEPGIQVNFDKQVPRAPKVLLF